ncbi:7TM diverse intracellular signaling domain-containing protein [Arcticibacterium luteifluviistationis]|uniref:7TM diverse intracellular signaling domain-containing protein n=1 Tax=Arcticibacterium luteifluviistationis TaxID=1784714 RepID=UPI0013A6D373|nr:7TM diverse intracellular signaling domain-containing protein [Arcticibacterium luteifluviistationis]
MKRIFGVLTLLILFQPLCIKAQELGYYRASSSNETLEQIQGKEFVTFTEKVNQGGENGVYWLKLKNSSEDVVCELASAQLSETKCYIDGERVYGVSGTIFPSFRIPANKMVYFKVTCEKEAFIPVRLFNSADFNLAENQNLLSLGLYYGFTLLVIVLNLFFFFSMKERSFFHYSIFLFFISAAIFQRDGLLHLILGNDSLLSSDLEIITYFFVALSATIFAIDYLSIERYWKEYKALLVLINVGILLSYILFKFTDAFFWMKMSELLSMSVLIVIWFTGLMLFSKNNYSKFFVLAYFAVLFMACDFFIAPLMGWPNLGITTKYLKIGGVMEMLLLTYAVVYRMRGIHKDHKLMVQELFNYTNQLNSLEEELEKLNEGQENEITTSSLSRREIEILELIAAGKINKEIAEELFISVNTVKYHTKKLYAKLHIKSRSEIQPGFVQSLT